MMNLKNRSVLHKVADEVPHNTSVELLLHAMWANMDKGKGIGLAAPQIGESKRVIIMDTGVITIQIINPIITRRNLGKVVSEEGCLSFPGLRVKMARYKQIVVEGFNPDWKPVKYKLRGLDAYVIQHEIDHLNGKTIAD